MTDRLTAALHRMPLIAILRGLRPDEAEDVGSTLVAAGFSVLEVPLNSPQPLDSIGILRQVLPDTVTVGAGTVLSPQAVQEVASVGGELIVMPHSDPAVIRAAKSAGLACAPGVATPTEAFAALAAGADVLKAFPGEALPPAVLKAWLSVLPKGTRIVPTGGILPATMHGYLQAGVAGFGIGSALYKPGMSIAQIRSAAEAFVAEWQRLKVAAA